MTIRYIYLDAFEEMLLPLRTAIERELDDALVRTVAILPIDQVDVVLQRAASTGVIPEYGFAGLARMGRIYLSFDPDSPRLDDPQRGERILGVLAHEIHHLVRMRGPGYGETFGEALISEGLAQCFETEVGAPVPFYATYLDRQTLQLSAERAQKDLYSNSYDRVGWFFGRENEPGWPRFAAYSLGFAVVRAWLSRTRTTAAAAVRARAAQILEAWSNAGFEIAPVE